MQFIKIDDDGLGELHTKALVVFLLILLKLLIVTHRYIPLLCNKCNALTHSSNTMLIHFCPA